MNRKKNILDTKYYEIKGESHTSSTSSEYTTCSDNPIENVSIKKTNSQESLNSAILSGQILPCHQRKTVPEEPLVFNVPYVDTNNECNSSGNILNQNLDAILDDKNLNGIDVFMDCQDLSQCDSYYDDRTKYLQLEAITKTKLLEMKSKNHFYANYSILNKLKPTDETSKFEDSLDENKALITIAKEAKVANTSNTKINNPPLMNFKNTKNSGIHTTNAIMNNPPLMNFKNNKNSQLEIFSENKKNGEINVCNKNCIRKVVFASEKSNEKHNKLDKSKNKKEEKGNNFYVHKSCCKLKERDIIKNCNTAESFISWEKICKSSDNVFSRRSHSFSELNADNENFIEDDETSKSFKSLDDTYLSNNSIDINDVNILQTPYYRYKSKSCDSLLKEVKHLPHILYDRFLKCLAKEIENIRKQNVVCVCQMESSKKLSNKENKRSLKCNVNDPPIIKISNSRTAEKTEFATKSSPIKLVTNQTKVSPEILKNLPRDVQKLSPKPVNKTPTTPKKSGLYSWQKEIVSPVGEYIRGKRQIPYKNSPNKKKL